MVFNVVALVALENVAKVAAASFIAGGVIYGLIPGAPPPRRPLTGRRVIQGIYTKSACALK